MIQFTMIQLKCARYFVGASLLTSAPVMIGVANANTLLPDSYTIDQVTVANTNGVGGTETQVTNTNDQLVAITNGTDTATSSTSISKAPFTAATTTVSGPLPVVGGGYATAYTYIEYYFEYFGPTGTLPVLIASNANLTVSTTGGHTRATASAFLDLGEPSQVITLATADNSSPSFSISTPLNLASDTLYNLQLSLTLTAQNGSSFPGTASASGYIDPYISLDPRFSEANQFQLLLSPGVGNSPLTTPIPATLSMFASGLGGLGLLGWRRKRKSQAAAA